MLKLTNDIETIVIALEDETALTNLQACIDTISPLAPKYYVVLAIPPADSAAAQQSSFERQPAEAFLQKCKSWLKQKYPFAKIESCLIEGRFNEAIVSLEKKFDADILIISHSTAVPGNGQTGAASSVSVIKNGQKLKA